MFSILSLVTCVTAWEAGVYIEPRDVSSEHGARVGGQSCVMSSC